MFDISTRLVSEQDEIYGVKTTDWENHSWKYLSIIGDERVISLQRTKVYVFSDSVLCLGKIHENPQSNTVWEHKLTSFKSSSQYRTLDRIDGDPMEFEWNIFPGYNTLQLSDQVKSLLLKLGDTSENFTGRLLYSCRCSTTSLLDQETMKKCMSNANLFSLYAKNLEKDNGHKLVLVLRKSGSLSVKIVHKENGTELQSK